MSVSTTQKHVRNIIVILLAAVLIILTVAPTSLAAAKSTGSRKYVTITNSPTKVGGYYYRLTKNCKLNRSKKKNSGYKTLVNNCFGDAITNGKKIYYLDVKSVYDSANDYYEETQRIRSCSANGKNKKIVKELPLGKNKNNWWHMKAVKGKNIILGCGNISSWKVWAYKYNFKNGKLKKIKNNCNPVLSYGDYVIGDYHYQSEGGPNRSTLYKITSSGNLKKVKYLGWLCNIELVGNKLYYGKATNKQYYICRCNSDGSGEKILGSVDTSELIDVTAGPSDFTSKSCKIYFSDGLYKYIYRTKSFVLIKKW